MNAVVWTPLVLGLLFLLPAGSDLAVPVVIILLLVEVIVTGLGALAPRVLIGHVVRSRKDEEQHGLQRTLDSLLPRISDMSEEEYGRMKRLQELHDTLRHSPESLLRTGAVLRTGGALLLSVLTILLTALAEEWVPAFMRSLGG